MASVAGSWLLVTWMSWLMERGTVPRDKTLEYAVLEAVSEACSRGNGLFTNTRDVLYELDDVGLDLDPSDPDYAERVDRSLKSLARGSYIELTGKMEPVIKITEKGVDELDKQDQPQQPQQVVNVGTAYNSMVGFNTNAELTNNIGFAALDREIEEHGGEDKAELREARQELERITQSQDSIVRGAFAKFSHLASKHPWFFDRLMQAVLGFVTQK